MLLEDLTKALSDQTRLRILLLLVDGDEVCVCELTQTLELSQPKISRHLAVLRENRLLKDRKAGLWVHYQLHPELPFWAVQVLVALRNGATGEAWYQRDQERLACPQTSGLNCN